jgi:hypothetical protein
MPGWRAGSVIANPAKVVLALQAAVVQGLVLWYRSGQSGAAGRYIVVPQWTLVLPGASGSSTIRAMDRVPARTVFHESAGERSSPSQVYSTGRVVPLLKASKDIEICFIVVSSSNWISLSDWSDIHPEDNYFDFLSCITIFPPSNEPVAL